MAFLRVSRLPVALLALILLVAACGGEVTPSSSAPLPSSNPPSASIAPTPAIGEVVPAPGSTSEVYRPNPGALVVAIDPGHGGCLDWGVPDPSQRGPTYAEKTITLGVGLALRDLLSAQGVTVVLTRTDDSALAGDDYPKLGCTGPPWRDVDGDGQAGFEETGRTRTRDELQARIDLANLARADLLVSIHINSMTQNGVAYQIAATQTFYDDETPWGEASGGLGEAIQRDVVSALDPLADYDRQDRGTQAVAYYLISRQWQEGDSCETPGDTWCKPHRGLQEPGVLTEIGSINLRAEQDLLSSGDGQAAAAAGIYDGIAAFLGRREQAVRYDALLPGGSAGSRAAERPGDGAPFVAPPLAVSADGGVHLPLRLTNTANQAWPAGVRLLAGWEPSEAPYLGAAPGELQPLDADVPALAPGESVELNLSLPAPPDAARNLLWLTLADENGPYTAYGSPALQLAVAE